MSDQERFFYGQGRVSLAELDATTGLPGKFDYLGDVSALAPKFATEKVQHKESNSGQRGLAASFDIDKTLTLDITIHKLDADNVAKFTRGSVTQTAAGTATAEALEDELVVGDYVYLDNPGVSDVVITDSAGTPATLVEGTDYSVEDANFGRIKILNVGTYVQPFKAAYSYTACRSVGLLKAAQKNYALRYEGIDLANNDAAVMVDFYKVAPSVLQQLDLITSGNDVAGSQVTADVLQDTTRSAASALGQFGSIRYVGVTA
jgi:hypothetical protein